jgi:hypothetical protein
MHVRFLAVLCHCCVGASCTQFSSASAVSYALPGPFMLWLRSKFPFIRYSQFKTPCTSQIAVPCARRGGDIVQRPQALSASRQTQRAHAAAKVRAASADRGHSQAGSSGPSRHQEVWPAIGGRDRPGGGNQVSRSMLYQVSCGLLRRQPVLPPRA